MRIAVPPDVTATADHWYWRPGWAPGRRMVTFHLTWENADAVGALAAAVAPALATVPALDPVPVPWLHLTMTGVGFTDEVSDAALAAVAEPVFAAWKRFGAVELVIEDVLVARESVMLTPAASGWLSESRPNAPPWTPCSGTAPGASSGRTSRWPTPTRRPPPPPSARC